MTDGGYYAIKGFSFQYDASILKILDSELDEKIELEQVEDISDKDNIYQIKYKEKSNYKPSVIKKTVCQLIEIFKYDKRNITLYAFFKDKKNESKKLTLDELDEIIGDCKVGAKQYQFDNGVKTEFIKKFKLQFSEDYISQFHKVIKKIEEVFSCDEDTALVIYPQIYKYLQNKVIHNVPEDKINRVCSKREIIEFISKNKQIIFYSSYSEYLGKEKYFKLLKKKYFTENNINPIERLFIIEVEHDITVSNLKKITLCIRKRFYKCYRRMIKSYAPYIHFRGINSGKLIELKKQIVDDDINIRDGYSFNGSDFNLKHLIEKCTLNNKISLKFIDREEHIKEVLDNLANTRKIYEFYINKCIDISTVHEYVKMKIDSSEDILGILG